MKTTIKISMQGEMLNIDFPTAKISQAIKWLKDSLTDFTIVHVKKVTV